MLAAALPQQTVTPTERYKVIFAGIASLILTVGLARFSYTPLLPEMRAHAGLSAEAGGWLAAINYAGYISGALAAATISDLEKKFVLYRISLAVAVLSTAAMGMTQDLYLWAALRYVSGLSSTGGLLIASGLVLNWLIRHHCKPELGLHFSGLGAGVMISGLAALAMAGRFDWATQWVWLAVLGCGFLIPSWLWMPRPQPMAMNAQIVAPPPPPRRWSVLLIAAYFCAGVGFVISATFIVAIIGKLPLPPGSGAWVWVLVGASAMPSCFIWDRVASVIRPLPALLAAYALQIASVLLSGLSDGMAANLLGAALFGNTFVGIVSLTLTLIGRRFPANPAKAMARLTISYGVAQILAPIIAGKMAAAAGGDYRGALFMAAAALAAGMVLLAMMLTVKDNHPSAA
jgi:predicted MFS family arabinose efflux permease